MKWSNGGRKIRCSYENTRNSNRINDTPQHRCRLTRLTGGAGFDTKYFCLGHRPFSEMATVLVPYGPYKNVFLCQILTEKAKGI